MSVDEPAGLMGADKPGKAPKTPVTRIVPIAQAPRRRMGDDDIDAAAPPDHRPGLPQDGTHFGFGVLHGPAVVPHGSFEPQKPKALEVHQAGVDVRGALGRPAAVAKVVVAPNVIDGHSEKMPEIRQVFGWNIPARQHGVQRFKALSVRHRKKLRSRHI